MIKGRDRESSSQMPCTIAHKYTCKYNLAYIVALIRSLLLILLAYLEEIWT